MGMLFAWMLVFGLGSYVLVHWSLKRELKWWKGKYSNVLQIPREEEVEGEGEGEMREVRDGARLGRVGEEKREGEEKA